MIRATDGLYAFLGAFTKVAKKKTTTNTIMPIRPSAFLSEHGTDSAPTGRIFMKFDI
jgi:hypothetical protein